MLLKMLDGGLINIMEDRESYGGCETCDYGSEYINEIEFVLVNGKIKVKSVNMYEYAISEGDIMRIILPNVESINKMTENTFFEWLKQELNNTISTDDLAIDFIKS